MVCLSPLLLSNLHFVGNPAKAFHQASQWRYSLDTSSSQQYRRPLTLVASIQIAMVSFDGEAEVKLKWVDAGPDMTEEQEVAISQLPSKMTKRCQALMKRLICFCHEDENLMFLLASWVKVMKPRRADWLAVLKELNRLGNPLFFEALVYEGFADYVMAGCKVMEYGLMEDSFEANVRDYTKLIDSYAKYNLLENAENVFQAMRSRGFICDQVTLTVLVNMYSKAGDLSRAQKTFEEIKLLGLPMDKRAYGSMIMAYIRAEMLELAESLMREMEAQQIRAGREVYKALLRSYSSKGNADGAQRVFDAIQFAGIVPDSKLCGLLLNAYFMAGQSTKARSVVENMKGAGIAPSDKCVALMLNAYENENELEKALAFLMDLEMDGIIIGQEASEVLVRWFRRLGVVNDVELVLRKFAEKRRDFKLHLS